MFFIKQSRLKGTFCFFTIRKPNNMAAIENRPFENQTFQNGRISLDRFINKKIYFHSKMTQANSHFGSVFEWSAPFENRTLNNSKKKKTSKCSEFEPPLYTGICMAQTYPIISQSSTDACCVQRPRQKPSLFGVLLELPVGLA